MLNLRFIVITFSFHHTSEERLPTPITLWGCNSEILFTPHYHAKHPVFSLALETAGYIEIRSLICAHITYIRQIAAI